MNKIETAFLSQLVTENIDDDRFVRLTEPFIFRSKVLFEVGYTPYEVEVPSGFVYDFESIPGLRGTSKRGGTGHDYLCRLDSVPLVTSSIAALVYLELMEHKDFLLMQDDYYKNMNFVRRAYERANMWIRRSVKYRVVANYPESLYFHKLPVMATYEEVRDIV